MYKSFVALLSLTAAFGAMAAPMAIPFTGLSADIHLRRNAILPVIEVRDTKTKGHKREVDFELFEREADVVARDTKLKGHKREAELEDRDTKRKGHKREAELDERDTKTKGHKRDTKTKGHKREAGLDKRDTKNRGH